MNKDASLPVPLDLPQNSVLMNGTRDRVSLGCFQESPLKDGAQEPLTLLFVPFVPLPRMKMLHQDHKVEEEEFWVLTPQTSHPDFHRTAKR